VNLAHRRLQLPPRLGRLQVHRLGRHIQGQLLMEDQRQQNARDGREGVERGHRGRQRLPDGDLGLDLSALIGERTPLQTDESVI